MAALSSQLQIEAGNQFRLKELLGLVLKPPYLEQTAKENKVVFYIQCMRHTVPVYVW